MLYTLTQYPLYNRQYHSYLLCKCGPVDKVCDPLHKCIPTARDKQVKRFDCFKQKWSHFAGVFNRKISPQAYTERNHHNWTDRNNYGITHFDAHPDKLCSHNIRFDVFHLHCAQTRKLMTYLRKYIRLQTFEFQDCFHAVLALFWTEYEVLICRLNKPFTSFQ